MPKLMILPKGLREYLLDDYGIDPKIVERFYDSKRNGETGYLALAWKIDDVHVEYMDLVEIDGKWEMQNDSCGPVTEDQWKRAKVSRACDCLELDGHWL